ncbi:hypothetical protein J437_LFUL003389 [Ladona fulva]|uniref:Adenosine deaminase n=1 Tax=Ladona fulva TaxID=123851 RepID=A0A8K0K396_LADFU|nr:hypothetical protein J437_LFUL003389 [Ladona fulva]
MLLLPENSDVIPMMLPSKIAFLISVAVLLVSSVNADYWEERRAFLEGEEQLFMGSSNQLSADEESANSILMNAKNSEFSVYYDNQLFPPARHFFLAKADIEKSKVFNILKKLPKGSLLHGHNTGMVSLGYLVGNITYRDHLYICVDLEQGNLDLSFLVGFEFAANQPNSSTECQWMLMDTFRQNFGREAVDQWLHRELSLITPNPAEKYPNGDVAWKYFDKIFSKVSGLFHYRPVFIDLYLQILKELLEDNIMYLEIRGGLPNLYDLEGNFYKDTDVLSLYIELTNDFKGKNPDFFGARYIYAAHRLIDNATFMEDLDKAREYSKLYPDFLAGFDLVGQEDKGRPLSDFANGLLTLPSDIKLFLHAGETDWEGLTDLNLVDAVLLNTTRIGHGYALTKHPLVMQRVKENGIGIEVNPISNQVLGLVDDLRNHPAATLIAENFPIVVCSDDPTYWDAIGLSYDFYETFMGLAGKDADLRFLKQLSMNSIIYSGMPESEKGKALDFWMLKWNQFIAQDDKKNPLAVIARVRSDVPLSEMLSSSVAFCFAAVFLTLIGVNADYWEERRTFLEGEEQLFMGASNQLNAEEESANSILMKAKKTDFSLYFGNQLFPPARHFFSAKSEIEKSQVFNILRELPKGSLLHGHDTGYSAECQWILMDNLRIKFGNDAVDEWLHGELSLITDNPKGMNLYDLEGKTYADAEVLTLYKEATDEFKNQNPTFFGARYIYAPLRLVNNATFEEYLTKAQEFHKQFPDFLGGFDLVGQEDKGRPLSDFAEGILNLPSDLKLFFHAGETNWQGMTDMNLVDAVLLNTTRIGHGYAILKHPLVMKQVKDRGIGIEVNPISNQVLALVDDLRNHPAAALIAENFPVVISSDDPTYWDALCLSHDFYEAFMGLAGKDADLRFLKQLSMNSIKYSAMPTEEKARAKDIWTSKWNQFIKQVNSRNNANSQYLTSVNSVTVI